MFKLSICKKKIPSSFHFNKKKILKYPNFLVRKSGNQQFCNNLLCALSFMLTCKVLYCNQHDIFLKESKHLDISNYEF